MVERWILRTHLGAGDGILQTGLAVALLDKFEGELWWPCYPQYQATFESIFVHYQRIRVFPVEERFGEAWGSPSDRTYSQAEERAGISGGRILKCGVYNGRGCWEDFSKQFYHDVDLPYAARWERCPIREAARTFNIEPANWLGFKWPAGKRWLFVHDDPRRGYRIWKGIKNPLELSVFKPTWDKVKTSILAYVPLIETADEIHVIDSAFFHLTNSLEPVGRLYLHKYARWPRRHVFRYETRLAWEYLH